MSSDFERWKKGKSHWNEWANNLLRQRDKMSDEIKDLDSRLISNSNRANNWFEEANVSFAGHAFEDVADFSDYIFPHDSDFSNSCFENAIFQNTKFCNEAKFQSCSFTGSVDFRGASFMGGADFRRGSFNRLNFSISEVRNRLFFQQTKFQSQLDGYKFTPKFMKDSMFNRADFSNCNLSGIDFNKAILSGADFRGATFDQGTKFFGCQVHDCKMDRYALECLDGYGGMTSGQRMTLDIQDDVAKLRSEYSGLKRLLLFIAFACFVFPYAWFVLQQWGHANFTEEEGDNTIALWEAILRFVYNGGENWQVGYQFSISFVYFLIALSYHLLRLILAMKTNALEIQQEASGIPARFSLNNRIKFVPWNMSWRKIYNFSKNGFFVYLAIVGLNLFHFFGMRIPISP